MRIFIIRLLLTIGFAIMAFAPGKIIAQFLSLGTESRFWARLAGYAGLVWVALGVVLTRDADSISSADIKILSVTRHVCGGFIIGLMFALLTKKFEDR